MNVELTAKKIIVEILRDINTRPILAGEMAKAKECQIEHMLTDWQERIKKVLDDISCSGCSDKVEYTNCAYCGKANNSHYEWCLITKLECNP